jgi:hypothetical protein
VYNQNKKKEKKRKEKISTKTPTYLPDARRRCQLGLVCFHRFHYRGRGMASRPHTELEAILLAYSDSDSMASKPKKVIESETFVQEYELESKKI